MHKVWQNEKISPELMASHSDLVGLLLAELAVVEARAKQLPKGEARSVKAQLNLMQVSDWFATACVLAVVRSCLGVSHLHLHHQCLFH